MSVHWNLCAPVWTDETNTDKWNLCVPYHVYDDTASTVLVKIISEILQASESSFRPRVMARIKNETVEVEEDTTLFALTKTFYGGVGDGFTYINPYELTWNDAKYNSTPYAANAGITVTSRSSYTGTDYAIWRAFFPFDTSSIPSNAQMISASIFLRGAGLYNTDSHDYGCAVVTSGQASSSAVVASDHWTVGFVLCSQYITFAVCDDTDYNEFILNATGLAHIKRGWEGTPTGYSMFSVLEGHDIKDEAPDGHARMQWVAQEDTGSHDPYMVTTYTVTGQELKKIISSTLQLSEGSIRLKAMSRIVDETLQSVEGSIKSRVLTRLINNALSLSDSSVRLMNMARFSNESESLVEDSIKSRVMSRVIDDDENLSESTLRSRTMLRIINATTNISEGIVDVLTYIGNALLKIIDETVSISKTILRPRTLGRIMNESVDISESLLKSRTMSRVVDEDENLIESGSRLKSMVRAILSTLNLSETKDRVLGFVRSIGDILNISETKNTIVGLVKRINESINLQENISKAMNLVKSISNQLSLNELSTKAMTIVRMIGNSLSIQESINRIRGLVKTISDNVSIIAGVIDHFVAGVYYTVIDKLSALMRVLTRQSTRVLTVSKTSALNRVEEQTSRLNRTLSFITKLETEQVEA